MDDKLNRDIYYPQSKRDVECFTRKHHKSLIAGLLITNKNIRNEVISYEKNTILIALGFFLSMLILFYQIAHPRGEIVYASASDSKQSIMSLATIPNPINTVPVVTEWTTRALVSAMSLNFFDYKKTLDQIKDNFTDDGWEGFNNAINSSYLNEIIEHRYLVDAIPDGPPVMIHNASYAEPFWQFQIPLLVTFHIGNVSNNSNRIIDVKVVPVSSLKNPYGHAIESINIGTD